MMKAAIIFTLLLTTVLCRPARRTFTSSESSEEQVKPARAKGNRAPVQAVVDLVSAVKSAITDILSESTALPDPSATPGTTSDQSQDDADDEEDNSEDTEENESDEDESGEPSTPSPVTGTTVMAVGTEEPTADTTVEPITPTVVTDQGRGDSLLRFPSDYKSNLYGEDKSYHKGLSPYKSYEVLDGAKRMAYDMTNGNEVEKGLKVYKALQVHADLLEEDTSTPEVESQGLDTSSPDQEASPKQALLPNLQEQEVSFSPSDAAPTDSSSATDEEAEESTASPSDSASASDESEDSEDATATPGAADSQSDESDSVEGDSDEEGALVPVNTTDMPMLAK
ncbi:osteopontin-like [Gadus chalcogrammus]|uniref:osteopontin-like n=1 Tax=Gadus chalcogrammus TaxID=1042646 RepID=UPI0024C4A0A9|nr:osteopontin-like [Gadus chalcogrammus]